MQPHTHAIKLLNNQLKEQLKAEEHVQKVMPEDEGTGNEKTSTLATISSRIRQINAAIVELAIL